MLIGGVPLAALAGVKLKSSLLDIDLTSTAGGLTCSRSSIGTAFDASGVLQNFATNALRRTTAGLLVEVAATNLVKQSQTLATTPWSASACTLANNAVTGVDGTTSASTLTDNATNTTHSPSQTSITGSGPTTVYAFLKAGTQSWGAVQINFGGAGTVAYFNLSGAGAVGSITTLVGSPTISSASIVALANGWYKCTVICVNNGGGDVFLNPASGNGGRSYAGSGTVAMSIGGVQLETATGQVPTSYIPTTTAAVTRAADTVTLPISGIGRLVLTFDDNSQQTISGISTGSTYSLIPANLNRPTIKRLQGFAA